MQAYWNSGILLNTLWENRKCIMEKLERLNRNHSQFMKSWNQTYIILNQVEPTLTRLLTYFLLMIYCLNEEKLTKSNWLYRNVKSYCLILCNQIIFHTGTKLPSTIFFFLCFGLQGLILFLLQHCVLNYHAQVPKSYLVLQHHLVEATFNKVSAGQLFGLHG